MSAPVKFILFFVGLLCVLVVALAVIVKTQVTPEKVRETLLPIAERNLNRSVDFGEIEVGLFRGISLTDLKVLQKNGEKELFSVRTVELSYQLWPLLKGQIVIDQILLDQPKLSVTRFPDGQFNFSDLLPKPGHNNKRNALSKKSAADSNSALNLLVKEVNLRGGELLYIDRFINARAPFRYTLKNLNFKARQITLDNSFPMDLSAVINGSNVDMSGQYDFSNSTGDLTIHLASFDLVQVAPYYRKTLPGKLGSAQLTLMVDVNLQSDKIFSKGKIDFEDVDLVLDEYRDSAISGASIGAEYALDYTLDKHLLNLSTLLFHYNDINLGAEGQFDLSSDQPFLVFSLLFNQLDLRTVMQNLPAKISRDYQQYSLAGLIDGRIDFAGRSGDGIDLLKAARLTLTDIRASAENLRAGISGDIAYDEKILKSDNLQLEYSGQKITAQVDAEKQSDGLFHGKFNLFTDTFDFNSLSSEKTEKAESANESRQGETPVSREKTLADDIGPYDLPVSMTGTLVAKHVLYKQLDVSDVSADLKIQNNHLTATNFKGQVGRGEVGGHADINFGVQGFAYSGELAVSQPDVAVLTTGLFPQSEQSLSGQLHWNGNFSGRGTLSENILRSLQLEGHFNLRDGIAKGSPFLGKFADFLGNSDLKVLSFNTLEGEYRLRNGLAHFDANLDSSKTKLVPSGTLTTDGLLDMRLDTLFSPEVLAKLGVSKKVRENIADKNGWGRLPLKIGGTLDHPKFSYDTEVLQQQLVEKASTKLLEKIAPEGGEDTEPLQQMLDDTLNKLFGQ